MCTNKLVFSFYGKQCPQYVAVINALITAGLPYKIVYKPVCLHVVITHKYAWQALNVYFYLNTVALPVPIINKGNNAWLFNIS